MLEFWLLAEILFCGAGAKLVEGQGVRDRLIRSRKLNVASIAAKRLTVDRE